MQPNTNDLTALLGARMCHDLISPLSAISNGLELLSMTGQPQSPEFKLISESVSAATAQIRFFRIAFGSFDPKSVIAYKEVSEIITDFFHTKRLTVSWCVDQDTRRDDVKISMITILCIVSALPYGGEITVTKKGNHIEISGSAKAIRPLPEYWDILDPENPEVHLPAALIQFGLLRKWIIEQKTQLEITQTEQNILVHFQAGELV